MVGGECPAYTLLKFNDYFFWLSTVQGSVKDTEASHNEMPDLKSLQSSWGDKSNTNHLRQCCFINTGLRGLRKGDKTSLTGFEAMVGTKKN